MPVKIYSDEPMSRWLEEFQNESDRAAAILGGAYLDDQLRDLLEAHFVHDEKRIPGLLNGPNAPLGTMSARIDLAYALGLLSLKECQDLGLIRKIRNTFAHGVFGHASDRIDFSTPSIASQCREFKLLQHVRLDLERLTPRNRFTMTAAILAGQIDNRRTSLLERGRIGPKPEVPNR